MKLLKTITLTAFAVALIALESHAGSVCLNNDLNNDGLPWQMVATVHFHRSANPDQYARILRQINNSGDRIDESNPQWEPSEDDIRIVEGRTRYYIQSIHGDTMKLTGEYTSGNINKHTKFCQEIQGAYVGLPFPVGVDGISLTVTDPHGTVHTADNLSNHTVKLHGSPFWWVDITIPRFRIDVSRN